MSIHIIEICVFFERATWLPFLPSWSSCTFESGQELQLAEVRDLADRIEFAVWYSYAIILIPSFSIILIIFKKKSRLSHLFNQFSITFIKFDQVIPSFSRSFIPFPFFSLGCLNLFPERPCHSRRYPSHLWDGPFHRLVPGGTPQRFLEVGPTEIRTYRYKDV